MKRSILILVALIFCLAGSAPAEDKVLRVGWSNHSPSLDPQHRLSGSLERYSQLVFDPLVRWTRDRKFEGRLAERWERRDPLTVRFYLRRGVRFHSGNPMTARDVKWTVDRIKTSRDFKALFSVFKSPEVIDDHTVDIKTYKPYPLVENLATFLFVMDRKFYTIFQPADASGGGPNERDRPIDAVVPEGYSFANENESGTGEYMVAAREPGEGQWVLKRFSDYWEKPGKGNVDEIVLTAIKDGQARAAALLSGEVDFILPVPPDAHERIRANPALSLYTMPTSRVLVCFLNQKKSELANKKVRQAFNAAVDNGGIVETIMNKTTIAARQLSPKGFAGYIEGLAPRFNLEKARALMGEAGYEKGFSVTMIATNDRYTNDAKIARAVAGMLAAINIRVDLTTMPVKQHRVQRDALAADLIMTAWHPDTEDSGNSLEYMAMCKNRETGYGQYNFTEYCNPKLDELVIKAQSETDPGRRAQLLQAAERIVYDDAVLIPLHYEPVSWASKKDMNTGAIISFLDHPKFGDLVIP